MGSEKRFTINMIAQVIAFLVNVGIGLLLTPYIVKSIGKEAYGFVGLANNFISYAQIVVLALNSMAARFVTICVNRGEYVQASKYFSSVFYSNLFLSIILFVFSLVVVVNLECLINIPVEMSNDVKMLFALIFLNFILSVFFSVYSIATFTRNRLDLASIRNITSNFFRVFVLLVTFCFFLPKVWYLGFATLVATIYIVITNIILNRKLLPELKISRLYWDKVKVGELLRSGFWNSVTQLSVMLASGLDLLIANLFIGAAAMGTLSLAKLMPVLILSLFGMMGSVFAPNLMYAYAQGDQQGLRAQLLLSIKFFGCISSIPIVILVSYGDHFFHLWIPNENYQLIYILSIIACFELCFALPLQGIWNVFTVTNKVKIPSINLLCRGIASFSFIILAMNLASEESRIYFLAGIASLIGGVNFLIFLPIYGARCLDITWKFFFRPLIKNLFSIILFIIVSFTLKSIVGCGDNWMILIGECFISTAFILIFNYFFVLDNRERECVYNLMIKCLSKK